MNPWIDPLKQISMPQKYVGLMKGNLSSILICSYPAWAFPLLYEVKILFLSRNLWLVENLTFSGFRRVAYVPIVNSSSHIFALNHSGLHICSIVLFYSPDLLSPFWFFRQRHHLMFTCGLLWWFCRMQVLFICRVNLQAQQFWGFNISRPGLASDQKRF